MATVSCCATDHEILLAILATLNGSGGSGTSVAVTNVIPGTSASDLGKAEDSPHTSGDVGVMALAVRNDAGTALAGDGDYSVLQVDSAGRLRTTATLTGATIELQRAAQPTITKTVVPVAAGDVVVLAANANRSGLRIQNTGGYPVTITYAAADGGTGQILQPMGVDDGITFDPDVRYTGPVTASWDGSNATTLTVNEWNQA